LQADDWANPANSASAALRCWRVLVFAFRILRNVEAAKQCDRLCAHAWKTNDTRDVLALNRNAFRAPNRAHAATRSSGLRASTASADARLNTAPRLRMAVIGDRGARFTLLLLNRRRWFRLSGCKQRLGQRQCRRKHGGRDHEGELHRSSSFHRHAQRQLAMSLVKARQYRS
jgi:hypothetical protein